jgi:hypothetical protein
MDTIITSEPDKLPRDIRALLDPAAPTPSGVVFFEERFTAGALARQSMLAIGLAILGLITLMLSALAIVESFRHPGVGTYSRPYEFGLAIAGFVFLGAAWLIVRSIAPRRRLIRAQESGAGTRYGLFLAGDNLVSHSWFDTTVIPRACFTGIGGHAISYTFRGEGKSFDLPAAFVGASIDDVTTSIGSWAAARA